VDSRRVRRAPHAGGALGADAPLGDWFPSAVANVADPKLALAVMYEIWR
jgi:hypothetical protein